MRFGIVTCPLLVKVALGMPITSDWLHQPRPGSEAVPRRIAPSRARSARSRGRLSPHRDSSIIAPAMARMTFGIDLHNRACLFFPKHGLGYDLYFSCADAERPVIFRVERIPLGPVPAVSRDQIPPELDNRRHGDAAAS